jgi:transcriptional regulator with XRE-family HTH domain
MSSSFFERYLELCRQAGETPNSVAKIIGASSGSVTAWKNGTEPRYSTIVKIANYFGVPVDHLAPKPTATIEITISPKKKTSAELTSRDLNDIAKDVERIMAQLDSSGDLMFDGDPMTAEARESMRAAMQLGLQAAKLKNKERFTPNKNKKG